jgi:hypothetical protein
MAVGYFQLAMRRSIRFYPPVSSTRSALCTTSPGEGIPLFRESMQSMNVEARFSAYLNASRS